MFETAYLKLLGVEDLLPNLLETRVLDGIPRKLLLGILAEESNQNDAGQFETGL
jgi:hypothetical protein